ncbi:MAG: hypothetical protein HWD59_10565 [Coxiellaceae bacterium]|nr:MAG: hypothetical protein HWD59_10565 [Coxiellaceae bacterium]
MKVLNVDITVSSHIFTLLNNTYIQPDGIVTSKDLEKIIALQQKMI